MTRERESHFARIGIATSAWMLAVVPAGSSFAEILVLHPDFQTQTFENVTGNAGNTFRAVGRHTNGTNGAVRSFTTIDLVTLPGEVNVLDASYRVPTGSSTGTIPASITLRALDPAHTVTDQVTWMTYDGSNNWTTPGGDLTVALGSVAAPSAGNPLAYGSTAAFVSEVQARRSAGQPLQFVLIGSNETSGSAGFIRTSAGVLPADSGQRDGALTLIYDQPGAASFRIDYGSNGQVVQSGFNGQSVGAATSVTTMLSDPLSQGSDVDVTLSVSSGEIQGRNRGNMSLTTTGLESLVDDLVFNFPGGGQPNSAAPDMNLSIDGLTKGNYTFTGYFNDSFDGGLSGNTVDILDAAMNVVASATVSDVRDGNPLDPLSMATFDFMADGINPVEFTLRGTSSDARFALNGFELTAQSIIPEPTALLIWVSVAAVLGITHARLRRKRA